MLLCRAPEDFGDPASVDRVGDLFDHLLFTNDDKDVACFDMGQFFNEFCD